jgi:hypothetical protein
VPVAGGVSGDDAAVPVGVALAFGPTAADDDGWADPVAELEVPGARQPCAATATMSSSVAAADPRARDACGAVTAHNPT